MMSPLNLYVLRSVPWIGATAVALPLVIQVCGVFAARFAMGRWTWAALLSLLASTPLFLELGTPESGVIAGAALPPSLAVATAAGIAAVFKDRGLNMRWLALGLPLGSLVVVLILLAAHACPLRQRV